MNNYITLCCYEYKKLLGRKMVWISLALCIGIVVLTSCAGSSVYLSYCEYCIAIALLGKPLYKRYQISGR